MRSASQPFLKAIGARLNAAYTAAGETCPWSVNPSAGRALPYGVLGTGTENDAFSTKTTSGSAMTHTLRIYSNSRTEASRLADIAIADLTDRTRPLTFASVSGTDFYQASKVGLDMNEVIRDPEANGDVYGAAIRLRILVGQISG